MTDDDWDTPFARAIGVYLVGSAIPTPDPRGMEISDDDFFVTFNADPEPIEFMVPRTGEGTWAVEVDTAGDDEDDARTVEPGEKVTLEGRSSLVLRRPA
jgi:glycogen operon protein